MIKTYYQLAKPGMVYGNALAAIAGFFLGSKGHFELELFVAMLLGMCGVMGSACVFNNILDRDIDAKMMRTKTRALVMGTISPKSATIYGLILGLIGFFLLAIYVNFLTVVVGLVGVFFYVVLYTLSKRGTVYSTLIGSVAGSMPLVGGYTAATNRFDLGAWLLFIILMLWQMPHFYSLAMYRVDEYRAAGLPVLPVKKGPEITKKHILYFIIAFTLAAPLLTIFKFTGYTYLVIIILISLIWLRMALKGFQVADNKVWGRSMFHQSLKVLLIFCLLLIVNSLLPLP